MIEETAQVIEIDGDQLMLQAQVETACGACSASKGCGTSVLSKVVGRKFTRFQATNTVDAEIGDTVVVGIREGTLVKGSLMIYIVPMLSMLIFALIADYILLQNQTARDALIALLAIAGLVTGSLVSRFHFKQHENAQHYTPVVLRKIIEHGKLQVR